MIRTISRSGFASDIISRYTSGTPRQLPGVDLLFMCARENTRDASPLARSIQNVWLINRAITENTVLNLNIHLDFLYSVFSKTVRELHESTVRNISMLVKRAPEEGKAPSIAGLHQYIRHLSPYPLLSDRANRPSVLKAQQNRVDTMLLAYSVVPGREIAPTVETESPLQSGLKNAGLHNARPEKVMRPAAGGQKDEAYARNAGSDISGIFPLKREFLQGILVGYNQLSFQRYVLPVLSVENQSILSQLRELWQIEPVNGAFGGGNTFMSFPQMRQRDIAVDRVNELPPVSQVLPILGGKMASSPQGLRPKPTRDDGNNRPLAEGSPKIPRLSPKIPTDVTGMERTGTPHTISRTYPAPEGSAVQMQRGGSDNLARRRESALTQLPLSGRFPKASDRSLHAPPNTDYTGKIALAQMEKPRGAAESGWPEQIAGKENYTSIAEQNARTPRKASASNHSRDITRTPQPARQPAGANKNMGPDLPLKVLSYGLVPRKGSEAAVKEGDRFSGIYRSPTHTDNHAFPINRQRDAFSRIERASIRQLPGKPYDFQAFPPTRDIVGGARQDFSYRKPAAKLNGTAQIPANVARPAWVAESTSNSSASHLAIPQASAYTAPGQTGTPASMIQPAPPRGNTAQISIPPAASIPGAAIVYRKESPARQEPPPVPQRVSQDIEFIKKTVKQSSTSTRKQKANMAVNLPGFAANTDFGREADGLRDIDRQINSIADKVYSALERRLRSEQMRKGLL